MSFYSRNRKSLDVRIVDGLFNLNSICKISKSGSKDQCNFWFEINFLSYAFQACH